MERGGEAVYECWFFFCNLEKRNYIEKMINELIDEDKEYTSIEKIMNIQRKNL